MAIEEKFQVILLENILWVYAILRNLYICQTEIEWMLKLFGENNCSVYRELKTVTELGLVVVVVKYPQMVISIEVYDQ